MKTTEEIFKDLQPYTKTCDDTNIFKNILIDQYRREVAVIKVNQGVDPDDEEYYTFIKTVDVFDSSEQKLLKIAADLEFNIKKVSLVDLYSHGKSAVAVAENGDEYIVTYI